MKCGRIEKSGEDSVAASVLSRARPDDEVRINDFTGGNQKAPQVASDGRGNFIVVWQSKGQDGSDFGIMGRR